MMGTAFLSLITEHCVGRGGENRRAASVGVRVLLVGAFALTSSYAGPATVIGATEGNLWGQERMIF